MAIIMDTPESMVDLAVGDRLKQARLVLNSRLEILQVMRSMQKHGTLLTAAYMPDHLMLLTKVLHVDESTDHVLLDCSSNQQVNQEVLHANFIVISARLSGSVTIQFFCNRMEQVVHKGQAALRLELPRYMLKLERREFHRINIPETQGIRYVCPATPIMTGDLLDISLTGARISIPVSDILEAYPDNMFRSCQIDLPGTGSIQVDLRVVRVWCEQSSSTEFKLIAGCRFDALSPGAEAKIERYIMRAQARGLHD